MNIKAVDAVIVGAGLLGIVLLLTSALLANPRYSFLGILLCGVAAIATVMKVSRQKKANA